MFPHWITNAAGSWQHAIFTIALVIKSQSPGSSQRTFLMAALVLLLSLSYFISIPGVAGKHIFVFQYVTDNNSRYHRWTFDSRTAVRMEKRSPSSPPFGDLKFKTSLCYCWVPPSTKPSNTCSDLWPPGTPSYSMCHLSFSHAATHAVYPECLTVASAHLPPTRVVRGRTSNLTRLIRTCWWCNSSLSSIGRDSLSALLIHVSPSFFKCVIHFCLGYCFLTSLFTL